MWCRRTYEFQKEHGLVDILQGYGPFEFHVNRFHLVFERRDLPDTFEQPVWPREASITCNIVAEAHGSRRNRFIANISARQMLSAADLPANVRDAITRRADEMDFLVLSATRFLAWRSNLVRSRSERGIPKNLEISADGYNWVMYEQKTNPTTGSWDQGQIADSREGGIGPAFERGEREPLYYRLLCEAQEIRKENPAGALIIGVAAAEVGLSRLMAWNQGFTGDRIVAFSTTDLSLVCREYLPNVLLRRMIAPVSLSTRFFDDLASAMEARYDAHHGSRRFSDHLLGKHLNVIASFLRAIDVCMGSGWAAQYIAKEYGSISR